MTVAGILLFVLAEPLVRIITPDEDVVSMAKTCLRIVAIIQPPQTMAWIYAGALRGAGDTKWPFIVTAVCNWGIRTLGDLISIPLICRNIPRPVTEELFRSNPDILPTISFALAFTVILMCADDIARWIWIGLRFRKGHWRKGLTEG